MRAVGVFGSMLKLTTTRLYFQYKRIFSKKRKKIKRKRHKKNKEGGSLPLAPARFTGLRYPFKRGNFPRNAPNIKLTKKSPYEKNLQTESEGAKKLGHSKGSADKLPKHK